MKKNLRTASFLALTLVFLAAGCQKQEVASSTAQKDNGRYSVGLHLPKKLEKQAEKEAIHLRDKKDKVSYAMGIMIGRSLERQGLTLDPGLLARGFQNAYSGKAPALTDKEIEQVKKEFRSQRNTAR